MAGLLDRFFGNADQTRALGLLGLGGMQGNWAGGAQAAMNLLAEAPEREALRKYRDMQLVNLQSEMEARKIKAQREQAELERAQRIQQGIPGLFRAPGMTGGQAVPQTFDGTDIPRFSKPVGAAPVQSTHGGFDVQQAIALGLTPEQITAYAGLQNIGRQKVARTVKGLGPDGKEYEYQVDEYGQRVGEGQPQWKAPHYQDLGGQVVVLDGYGNRTGGLAKSQSPDSAASVAATLRGQNMVDARTRERLQFEQGQPRGQFIETTNGYVLADPKTGAVRPVTGTDGQPLKGKAADRVLTDSQAKANLFGTRMKEADRILSGLEGKYSPLTVNAKTAIQEVPVVGGPLGAMGNLSMGANNQQAEQAQRDFINAVLRRESGAVISQPEFDNARKQYFPQPGDSKQVLEQKRRNRLLAISGMEAEVPGGFRIGPSLAGSGDANSPDIDALLKKYGGK